jgi:hypothetical protein
LIGYTGQNRDNRQFCRLYRNKYVKRQGKLDTWQPIYLKTESGEYIPMICEVEMRRIQVAGW